MWALGLTGSIATGKSTVLRMFAEMGVPVFSSDDAVHELYRGAAVAPVEALFPGVASDGEIDRSELSRRVLGWPDNPALNISSIPQNVGRVTRVSMLGRDDALPFKQNDAGMTVSLPVRGAGRYAHALKIEGLKLDTSDGH